MAVGRTGADPLVPRVALAWYMNGHRGSAGSVSAANRSPTASGPEFLEATPARGYHCDAVSGFMLSAITADAIFCGIFVAPND